MRLELDVTTHDRTLGNHIVGRDLWAERPPMAIAGGATLEFVEASYAKAVGIAETLQFIVDTAVGVEVNLLAAWLYDRFKNKQVERITINRRVITKFTREEFYQVIEEEIKRGG